MEIKLKFHNNISNKINEFQKEYGATKTFIAQHMGISRQSLNSLETSKNPTLILLIKLACILKCQVSDLYSYEEIY